MITVKKVSDLVNSEKAKVNYYVYDEQSVRNYMFSLVAISGDERKHYEDMCDVEKQEYISTSAEILMPKMSVDRCANIYRNNDLYNFQYTLEKVHSLEKIHVNDLSTAFSLYIILHEFGHWNDFVSKDKKPFHYNMPDSEEAREVFEYRKKIQDRMAIKQEPDEEDKEMMKEYIKRYNAVPIERRANDYADKNYKSAYSILRQGGIVH